MADSTSISLGTAKGSDFTALHGIGAYRPERVVSNDEVCKRIDSTDEWIYTRSGIRNRGYASDAESLEFMATEAAKRAIESSGIEAEKIDAVLLCSSTWPWQVPHGAPRIAANLGRNGIAAVDLTAGCSGFGYGLAMATNMIRGGGAHYVLVIGAERMSDGIDPTDRNTAFIFGDGAGAVVVGPSEENRIGPVVWGSDGEKGMAITQTTNWLEYMRGENHEPQPYLAMDGNAVFRWAAYTVAKVAKQTLDAAGIKPEDIDVFIPHQANGRINAALAKNLKLPESVVIANDIENTGNTSAASIPLAMETLMRTGEAKEGDLALLVGFGSGLTYAGQVVRLPKPPVS